MYHLAVRGVIYIVYVYLGSGKLNDFWLLINERGLAPNDLVSYGSGVCVLAMMMYSPMFTSINHIVTSHSMRLEL